MIFKYNKLKINTGRSQIVTQYLLTRVKYMWLIFMADILPFKELLIIITENKDAVIHRAP